jgi:Fe-S cluster assembly iron-binding protein IscA
MAHRSRTEERMNLNVSPEAVQHLQSDLDGRMLRIAFTTGCGGSGYRLGYADGPADGDRIINVGEIRVAMDDMAASKLDGATITYDSEEDGYLLDHPDAVNVAWCG